MQEILAGTGVKFWPYVGQIVGHPCLLRGSIDEIVADTERAAALGVDGINLLAYRYDGDVEALSAPSSAPPTCRSSAPARSTRGAHPRARAAGAWAFTIGTAARRRARGGAPLSGQLEAALEAAAPPADVRRGPEVSGPSGSSVAFTAKRRAAA